jgi:long-chain acyl-CoA synthetase
VNHPGKNRIGTVGLPIPGVEVRIAPDGEILVRGPNVMKGYFKDPAATAEAIDADGWFRTGDVGTIDTNGFLRITDRKKDLIVTSGGKKVAPQAIENQLLQDPIVRQVCLVGEGRNYVAALIVPDFDLLAPRARAAGIESSSRGDLVNHREIRGWFEAALARVNAGRTSYETVKRFRLLRNEWTIESGELTPTLKVRRKEIARKHAGEIEELYKEG